jgi:GTPase SAR1 family protein
VADKKIKTQIWDTAGADIVIQVRKDFEQLPMPITKVQRVHLLFTMLPKRRHLKVSINGLRSLRKMHKKISSLFLLVANPLKRRQ